MRMDLTSALVLPCAVTYPQNQCRHARCHLSEPKNSLISDAFWAIPCIMTSCATHSYNCATPSCRQTAALQT